MKKRFFGGGGLAFRQPSVHDRLPGPAAVAAVTAATGAPLHEPALEPRDEAVFLLTAAAEIEHALMVQYLYGAYSLQVLDDQPNAPQVRALQDLLLQIAREEMGHLATVQNLLHLVGGPLNFNREHSPYAGEILSVSVQARAVDPRLVVEVRGRRKPASPAGRVCGPRPVRADRTRRAAGERRATDPPRRPDLRATGGTLHGRHPRGDR